MSSESVGIYGFWLKFYKKIDKRKEKSTLLKKKRKFSHFSHNIQSNFIRTINRLRSGSFRLIQWFKGVITSVFNCYFIENNSSRWWKSVVVWSIDFFAGLKKIFFSGIFFLDFFLIFRIRFKKNHYLLISPWIQIETPNLLITTVKGPF